METGTRWDTRALSPDVAYIAEKQRLVLYEFDEEQPRPYFELTRMLRTSSAAFWNPKLRRPGVQGWDPAVRLHGLEDANSGELLGGFYADWFPRENKRGGAFPHHRNPDEGRPHLGLICGNLTPPVGAGHRC